MLVQSTLAKELCRLSGFIRSPRGGLGMEGKEYSNE